MGLCEDLIAAIERIGLLAKVYAKDYEGQKQDPTGK